MFQRIIEFLATKEVYSETEAYYTPTFAGNMALFLVIAIIFVLMAIFAGKKKKFQVKQLAFSAMAITLAVVTSTFMKFARLPYGGSITFFSMFFICFIGYLYGTRAGVLAGIAFGFINLFLDPVIMHPVQLLLDYPITFGCLGLAGVFSKSKYGLVKGYVFGVIGRYICHVITGCIFFYMYAPKGWNTFLYSLAYNASYIVPEAVVTVIILSLPVLSKAISEVKRMQEE